MFSVCLTAIAAVLADYVLLAMALASLILLIAGRVFVSRRAIKAFRADVSAWRILPLELSSVWHSFADRLRYLMTNRNDFTCHKL